LQVIAAFVANLGTINTGLVFGFSAVAIPQLQDAESFIKIDEEQASWIGKYTEQVHFLYDLQIIST
jgi:SP family facilitated glucose transporter-like MFS transporter 8